MRKITEIHIHHTEKPCQADFNGKNHNLIIDHITNYHIQVRKFSDIAYNLISDGVMWPGTAWKKPLKANHFPREVPTHNWVGGVGESQTMQYYPEKMTTDANLAANNAMKQLETWESSSNVSVVLSASTALTRKQRYSKIWPDYVLVEFFVRVA